jgi:hypothetical protein
MKLRPTLLVTIFFGIGLAFATSTIFAQSGSSSPSTAPSPVLPPGTSVSSGTSTTGASTSSATGMPSEAEMMKMMMEMAKVNDNHKLLASTEGTWSFVTKMWMNGDPSSKPEESKGTAVRKSVMGGRYIVMDVNGKFKMPGPDGKPKEMEFKGQGIDGYDNAKQKFVSTWMDSMTTGIMMSEGSYDPATKTLTYTGEYQMAPAMKEQIRSVIKLADKDHMVFEWYENRGGTEAKTMEIDYTRSGKAK